MRTRTKEASSNLSRVRPAIQGTSHQVEAGSSPRRKDAFTTSVGRIFGVLSLPRCDGFNEAIAAPSSSSARPTLDVLRPENAHQGRGRSRRKDVFSASDEEELGHHGERTLSRPRSKRSPSFSPYPDATGLARQSQPRRHHCRVRPSTYCGRRTPIEAGGDQGGRTSSRPRAKELGHFISGLIRRRAKPMQFRHHRYRVRLVVVVRPEETHLRQGFLGLAKTLPRRVYHQGGR